MDVHRPISAFFVCFPSVLVLVRQLFTSYFMVNEISCSFVRFDALFCDVVHALQVEMECHCYIFIVTHR